MPGPGNKSKSKVKSKGPITLNITKKSGSSDTEPKASSLPVTMCLTLEEDEMTRCNLVATHGAHKERCKKHYTQYVDLYKRYKDSAKIVDEIRHGGTIPTKEQIGRYTEVSKAMDKARSMREFIEAIRVERTGREIHGKRFFMKIDEGHKRRIKLLEKELIRGVEALDDLQSRAYYLHVAENPLPDWSVPASSQSRTSEEPDMNKDFLSPEKIVEAAEKMVANGTKHMGGTDSENCDLIDVQLRAEKTIMLRAISILTDQDVHKTLMREGSENTNSNEAELDKNALINQKIMYQFALRIVFYEPTLYLKSIGKVSFKDMILSEDFTFQDIVRFVQLFAHKLGLPLLWLKDSVVEALAMTRQGPLGTAANVGGLENRIKVLDGWIFNVAHVKGTSNETWFRLILLVQPPKDIENRFVRLCNTYDDLIAFLAVGGLGMAPSPSFCNDAEVYRRHLSLSGVVVADIVSFPKPPSLCGPIVTTKRAKRQGYVVWAEIESRAYIFGAVRNEPDAFTNAFLHELKSRPDLFHLVLRSDTDPEGIVEEFGHNGGALPVIRYRSFEAPSAPFHNRPTGKGDWTPGISAKDKFYGTKDRCGVPGYLTELKHGRNIKENTISWFHFKKFPVKYFIVIDPIPGRHHIFLAQQLAWAALRAQGFGKGEYEEYKYAKTSDMFFDQRAAELLSWGPSGWGTTKMEV